MRIPPTRKQTLSYVKIEEDYRVKFNLGKSKGYFATDSDKKFIFTDGRLALNEAESKMIGNLGSKKETRPKCAKCHNRVNNTKSDNYRKYKVCSTFCRKALTYKT